MTKAKREEDEDVLDTYFSDNKVAIPETTKVSVRILKTKIDKHFVIKSMVLRNLQLCDSLTYFNDI